MNTQATASPSKNMPGKPGGALLTRELDADCLIIDADVAEAYLDWGQPNQRAIGKVTSDARATYHFATGSLSPKVEAACAFVLATGMRAVICSLDHIEQFLTGSAGTQVCLAAAGGADTL